MIRSAKSRFKLYCLLFAALGYLTHTSSFATSRLGTAVVKDLDGRPCFSIESNSETRNGLPLRVIAVTAMGDSDFRKAEAWHIMSTDLAHATLLRPTECILYGEAPSNTVQRTFKKLDFFRIYNVEVVAKEENSNMVAYGAAFCIVLDSSGKTRVQAVPSEVDSAAPHYQPCEPPR